MNNLLLSFAQDPENASLNYELARLYHVSGQTASAVSYYLRCAERTKDKTLQYECLLHTASCFISQEKRNLTVRGLLQHAITIQPSSPEAYWLLSILYERDNSFKDHWMNAYTYAALGEYIAKSPTKFINCVGFPGMFALKFQRAVSAWWAGLCDESRQLFMQLQQSKDINSEYAQLVQLNIRIITQTATSVHPTYKTKALKDFIAVT